MVGVVMGCYANRTGINENQPTPVSSFINTDLSLRDAADGVDAAHRAVPQLRVVGVVLQAGLVGGQRLGIMFIGGGDVNVWGVGWGGGGI
jgi:hypothetical protein